MLLRLREDEPGLGQSRLLTHVRPQHSPTRPCGRRSSCKSRQEARSPSGCVCHPSGWAWALHRASVLQNPPSARWGEQYPFFSGPGRDQSSHTFEGSSGGRPRTECVLWVKSTGFRARPTWVWALAWPLFKHSTSPSVKWA